MKEGICVAVFPALRSGTWASPVVPGGCLLHPEPQMKQLQWAACVARSLIFFQLFPDMYTWSHPM